MSNILYIVATDKNGKLIKANDAEKGHDFSCPVCKAKLTLRKSGKTGKGTRRPHFAHRALSPNCTPETALHLAFKTMLAEKIQKHISAQEPLSISWSCPYCHEWHSGNLLKKINAVSVEHDMTDCRPDIALFDNNNKVFAVIEIVVTHEPRKSVLKFYAEKSITLIQINLESDKDIDELDNKIANPDFVGACLNPKCKICGRYQQKITMIIVDTFCRKCGSAMKVAIIRNGEMGKGGISLSPDEFYPQERELAKSRGAVIIKVCNTNYFANACPNCGMFVPTCLLPAINGSISSEKYDIDYRCAYCAEVNENARIAKFNKRITGRYKIV